MTTCTHVQTFVAVPLEADDLKHLECAVSEAPRPEGWSPVHHASAKTNAWISVQIIKSQDATRPRMLPLSSWLLVRDELARSYLATRLPAYRELYYRIQTAMTEDPRVREVLVLAEYVNQVPDDALSQSGPSRLVAQRILNSSIEANSHMVSSVIGPGLGPRLEVTA